MNIESIKDFWKANKKLWIPISEKDKIEAFKRAALVESEIAALNLPADQLLHNNPTRWNEERVF